MDHSKKNSSWLMPSFDSTPMRKSSAMKRTTSQVLGSSIISNISSTYVIPLKRRNTSSLSALLEACEPRKPSELVVSRQKQQDILAWLQHKVRKGQPCALILYGPSGCGKTAALRVLAKENGFNVTEWITPVDQAMDENNRVMRQGDRFEDFLIRVTRYSSVLSNSSSRLLLVKDFPNVYFQDTDSFFSVLEKYFEMGKEPIVFICSETGNSKLLQMLFPPNVKEKFGIDSININPVTQTAMKNALKRIGDILNLTAGQMIHVSQLKIDEILSNNIGDIRNAVLNLIFISLKVPEQLENVCSSRVESLGLLHGVGRVINPKRTQNGNSWKFVHDPDEIAAFFQSQATVYLKFIQENYLNTIRGIEEANACANILSLGDVLNSEWRDINLTKVTLSFCTRGLMVMNEKPVSGWNPVRKPQNDKIDMQRCLGSAEIRWYESIIKSNSKRTEELPDFDTESIIE
ncbi:cell cycle checkpoint protein RAD17 [Hylaeus volcanicus]|uniref:cell cycle checkpoint protein RAD17 n=1 Tax=Hylaeus volcanicus TaxID=313075 RepID=UPI0023B7737D|nr:cell cycle checkpoint protein RAD17 [Hylaeus volcanicus]